MRRRGLILSLIVAGVLSLPVTNALAFHDFGVARCNACHTMHNSENGALIDPDSPNGNPYLLRDATASDVCISCHGTSGSRGVFGTDPLVPVRLHGGGDFAFLLEDNIYDRSGSPLTGSYGGHNVITPSRGVGVDPVLTQSPGGNYPSNSMSCTSCHDPHGNEHFRLLYGIGHVEAGNYTFTRPAPNAVGIALSSTSEETNTNHTAYRSGMSNWCGNCHGNYHNNTTQLIHPSGQAMGASIANIYNAYNGTVDQTGGNAATAYVPQVPFEDLNAAINSTQGPTALSQVSCITCHRAHASSAPNIGRWDFNVQFVNQDGATSGSYPIPSPYTNPNQRSLCNKCHNKDAGDHNPF